MPTLAILLFLVKATGLLLVALGASLALSRASAGSRHLVWLLALIGLLLLPALALWGPLPVRVLPATWAPAPTPTQPIAVHQADRSVVVALPPPERVAPTTSVAPRSAAEGVLTDAADHRGAVLLVVWALGALLLGIRLAWGVHSVRGIVQRGRPLEHPDWQTPLYEIADRLGLRVVPRLLRSNDVNMPFAAGLVCPTIVLPAESDGWNAERRSAVLIHELGHIRRGDLVGHTIGRIACALYWFHPLVWTAARRLRAESERACDDLALVFGTPPSDYAEHLLDIVIGVRDFSTPSVALAMAHRKEFEGRMLAILDPKLHRQGPSPVQTASIVGTLGLIALLVGAAAPVPRVVPAPAGSLLQVVAGADISASLDGPTPAAPTPATSRTPTAREHPTPKRSATTKAPTKQPGDDRVTLLAKTLRSDAKASVRRVAAWGLSRYAEDQVAVEALAAAAGNDADASVREMAVWAMAEAQAGSAATAALTKAVRQDKDPKVRATAVWALGSIGDDVAVETLTGVLADSDPKMREMAAWSIGSCEPSRAPSALISALSDRDRDVRESVAWALYTIQDPAAASAIDTALRRETDSQVQLGLIKALGASGEGSVTALERLVASPDSEVRDGAIRALAGGDASGPWPWPRPEPRPFP
jgi:beta-lactamase regulating signal transducer with metallopeptidase domain/HEAT repeat protein